MLLLQTSDWHLGRTLLGRSLIADQAHALDQIVEIVAERRPEVVLILGDLFERPSPQDEAVALLDSVISRLVLDCKVQVVVVPGQQDNVSRLALGSRLVDRRSLQVITGMDQALSPIMLEDADGPLHLIALPYLSPPLVARHFRGRVVRTWSQAATLVLDHLTRFRRLRKKAVRGVVAAYLWLDGGQTCGVEGALAARDEQPVATSIFEGISFAALGSLHTPQRLGEHGQLCYSGSILPYSFQEADQVKSVVLADVDAEGRARIETVPLKPRRLWHRLEGTLADLLRPPETAVEADDFVQLCLTEALGPISPEAMDTLQRLYPNLVEIQRPHPEQPPDRLESWQDVAGLFGTFYAQATGHPLDSEAKARIVALLDGPS